MKINNINSFSLFIFERIFIEFFISSEIDDKFAIARFTRHVYIMKKLKTKFLLNNDILGFENMISHLKKTNLLSTTTTTSLRR